MVDSIEEGKMRLKPQSLERRRETRRTRKEERHDAASPEP
jgi:hypothetical protein